MKLIIFLISIGYFTLFTQAQDITIDENGPLKGFSKAIELKDFTKAKSFLLEEEVNEQQLSDLKIIIDKVIKYIEAGAIKPSKEGSKQISINLRDSVIFLLEENGQFYLTKGTTSNIPQLLKMAELLGTPDKTMDYFLEKVKLGDLEEASSCFVSNKETPLIKDEMEKFESVLKHIKRKKIIAEYQGRVEQSLASYKVGTRSVSFALESGDWQFTKFTREHIPELYSQVKEKKLFNIIPQGLHEQLFLIKNWQWLGIIVILILGIFAQWLLQKLFNKAVVKSLQLSDKETNSRNFKSVTILSLSLSWYLLFPLLGIDEEAVKILTNASAIMAMVSALFVVFKILDFFKDVFIKKAEKTDNKIDDVLIPMFHKLIKLATCIVGIVLIASNIGINVASLLAGIGLAGMAFALAAKDTVENIFGSITVLLDKPFEVGDWVVINGVEGTVEQIGLRSTRIRTFYCSQVNVPNSTLIQATVDNYGRRSFRRIKTMLSLTYDTPPDKIEAFCEGVRELIRKHPYTRKDTYQVYFNNFNAASLDVLLYCFLDTSDWAIELREKQRLFLDIIRLAGKLEVEFAFPTQTIHMANPDQLYPAETETNLDQINQAIMSGRQLGNQITEQSVPDKGSVPKSIDFIKGNSYYEGSKKS